MGSGNGRRILLGVLTAALFVCADASAGALPNIGPAAEFTLTDQEGQSVSLRQLHGKVVVLSFIYASCADACPALIARIARLQQRLGGTSASRAHFVAISVDPARDTPAVLREYAGRLGAGGPGWSFLTGSEAAVREVARRYGVAVQVTAGEVEHTFLTSLIDAGGSLRVQYLGTQFNPDEMLGDIRALLAEPR